MKICGLITEYHPFHNGHLFHVQEAKKSTGADYCIAVMSGNYVQRGTPAILDQYTRAKMALAAGVDVVLELPSFFSTMSAEYFAFGGVSLLHSLSCVDSLCFGSELGDLNQLSEIASVLSAEPEEYQQLLRSSLKEGNSFPKARQLALITYLQEKGKGILPDSEILFKPNNILAIEYLKSLQKLHSTMVPYTITRMASDYHDSQYPVSTPDASKGNAISLVCSATALRSGLADLMKKNPSTEEYASSLAQLLSYVPKASSSILEEAIHGQKLLDDNDFSEMICHALWEHYAVGYTAFADVSKELSDRIQNTLFQYKSFTQYCDLLKTKDMTYTRICRGLLHILLHITKDEILERTTSSTPVPYCRLLGFRKEAGEVLTAISQNSKVPIISKLADYKSILSESAAKVLEEEIRRAHIYNSMVSLRSNTPMVNEFTRPMIVL